MLDSDDFSDSEPLRLLDWDFVSEDDDCGIDVRLSCQLVCLCREFVDDWCESMLIAFTEDPYVTICPCDTCLLLDFFECIEFACLNAGSAIGAGILVDDWNFILYFYRREWACLGTKAASSTFF